MIKNIKKTQLKIISIFFIVLYLAISIYMLFYKVPWVDEVYFADVTHSVLSNNTLEVNLFLSPNLEEFMYGPIYFYSQKIILLITGFGMWQFRLLNFISGLLVILLFWHISKFLHISKVNSILFIVLVAMNGKFVFNMRSGRMDLFALFLFISGVILFQKEFFFQKKDKINYLLAIFAGIIISLSYLTSPRIGFYFLAFPILFLIEILSNSNRKTILIKYSIFSFAIILPITIYAYTYFGSISDYIHFYLGDAEVKYHLGQSTLNGIGIFQIISLFLWIVSAFLTFKFVKNFKNPFIVMLFIVPVFHLFFIKEVGPYSAMMMPFIYLGIMLGIEETQKRIFSIIPAILAIIFVLIFLNSTINDIASYEFTNPSGIKSFLKTQKIKNKNVLADFRYYYFITKSNSRFISFDYTYNASPSHKPLTSENLVANDIDIAIISLFNYKNNIKLFENLGFEKLIEFKSQDGRSVIYKFARRMGKTIRSGYDGVVLIRNINAESK